MRKFLTRVKSGWSRWDIIPKKVALWGLPISLILGALSFTVKSPQWQGLLANTSVSALTVVATVVIIDDLYDKKRRERNAPSAHTAIVKVQLLIYRRMNGCYLELEPKKAALLLMRIIKEMTKEAIAAVAAGKPDPREDEDLFIHTMRERGVNHIRAIANKKSFTATRSQAKQCVLYGQAAVDEIDEVLKLRHWALTAEINDRILEIRENLYSTTDGLSRAILATESRSDEKDAIEYVTGMLVNLLDALGENYYQAIDTERLI